MDNTYTAKRLKCVRRGVIQGDIIHTLSPIFFILTMEQLFRTHDPTPTGVSMGNYIQIGMLGYADDATLASLAFNVHHVVPHNQNSGGLLINRR